MTTNLQRHKVWDRSTRLFHWINAITVLTLIFLGILILNARAFGIVGEGKVLLKTVHAYVGYVFAINLFWRLVRAFTGGYYARWKQFLPVGKGYLASLKIYSQDLFSGKRRQYLGHNPLGRIVISLFFLVLLSQVVTGLVVAGTDLYLPPFGHYFADWVTAGDSARLAALVPGDKSVVVDSLYKEMRAFREPFISLHEFGFFVVCALVVLHLGGVVFTELKEKNGLVSAMITGDKVIEGEAEDQSEPESSDQPLTDSPSDEKQSDSSPGLE